jgi:hypothetical protein
MARILSAGSAGRWKARQPNLSFGPTDAARLPNTPAEMIVYLILSDRAQPAAKAVAGTILAKCRDVGRDCLKDILEHVRDLLIRDVRAATPTVDKRGRKADELVPGRAIPRFDALHQAPGGSC